MTVVTGRGTLHLRRRSVEVEGRSGREGDHASTRRSSPPARSRSRCPSSRTTTRASSIPPARWSWRTSRSGCWSSAAASSGSRWRPCITQLGSKVIVVELMDQLMPGADKDIVTPLEKRIEKRYEKILLKTKVTAVKAEADGLHVTFEGPDGASTDDVRQVLVAVGRRPNGKAIDADAAGVDGRRARLHRRRQADAHQRARTSSPSATSSASPCWRTRRCTRAKSRPKSPPATRARSTPRSSPRSPTPIPRSPGSA